ncbi:hypothetical protein ACFY4C_40115 [Actinomadura viridis]|uniref:hypothetical protein n=1 Tax=Actinomadura viridis TaxID=58110 RepID=UPI00368181D8
MPKRQSTAAKHARQAARGGAQYPQTLAAAEGEDYPPPAPPGPDPVPCPVLPYQVQYLYGSGYDTGRIHGRDYTGSEPRWWTLAWCATAEDARQVAAATIRWSSGARAAQIWGPAPAAPAGTAPGTLQERDLVERLHAGPAPRPDRPSAPFNGTPPGVRPPSPAGDPQPTAAPGADPGDVPGYCLHVWTPETGWRPLAWCTSRGGACVLGADLGVGVPGGRYPFGDVHGPGRNDWAIRARCDRLPDESNAERYAAPTRTFADLYHPDHAADREHHAAQAAAQSAAIWADPGPGRCSQCGNVRPLVWSWDLCDDCYRRSAFDPPITEFTDPDGDLYTDLYDDDPEGRAEAAEEDRLCARYGE